MRVWRGNVNIAISLSLEALELFVACSLKKYISFLGVDENNEVDDANHADPVAAV